MQMFDCDGYIYNSFSYREALAIQKPVLLMLLIEGILCIIFVRKHKKMEKTKLKFEEDLKDHLAKYFRQRKNYGQNQPNLEFKRIDSFIFRNGFKLLEEFPIPPFFEVEFYVYAYFNDMRQGFNPHKYYFFIRKVMGEFNIDHFTFVFSEAELIDSTTYPN